MLKTVMLLAAMLSLNTYGEEWRKVAAPIDEVFSPVGFDSNDNGQVIVTGHFPNLCYKSPSAKVKVNGKKIEVKVEALYNAQGVCAEMVVPFMQVVELGLLDRGDYKIVVNKGSSTVKSSELHVDESTSSSVDDFVYANVEYVEKSETGRKIQLKGHNPSDCLVLEEVKFIANGKNSLSVLPIMKQVSDFCPMKLIPFSYEVEVPKVLPQDIALLHVRVMDGRSVNTLFPNYRQ